MINKIKPSKINIPILILLLSNAFVDTKINLLLSVFMLGYIVITNKGKIKNNFSAHNLYCVLLLLGCVIGIIACLFNNNIWYTFVKQLYYFLMPVIYWYLGYLYQQKSYNQKKDCLYTVVFFSYCFALIDIVCSAITLIKMGGITSVYLYRETIGLSGGVSFLGFVVLLYFYNEIQIKKKLKNIILITTLISLLMHFSRTSIVQIFIFVMFMLPFSKIRTKFKTAIIGIASIVIIVLLFPNLFESFMTKLLQSFTEMGFRQSNWNEWSINNNWRGYEVYCAIKQFNTSDVITQVFGNGFGFQLDPGGYASLVTDEDGLIFLHNGYFTNLLLWGIIGFILYVIWLLKLYRLGNHYNSRKSAYFQKAMVVMFAVCTYFVNGPLFSLSLSIFFLVLGIVKSRDKMLTLENG